MARFNNFVKFSMINLNIIASLIGLALFGFAFYLWFSDWGALDKGFFQGIGGIVFLFGLCVLFGSCIGCQGISNQTVKFGFCTGRKIIGVHLGLLIFALGVELYVMKEALSAAQQYQLTYEAMDSDPDAIQPYAAYESLIGEVFNRFFFGASSECSKTLYLFFWNWVNGNCPADISESHCQGCESYSLTFCRADSTLCFDAGTDTQDNPYCPYTLCRAGVLQWARKRVLPFSVVLAIMCLFQLVLIMLDFMILCFHPRDSLEQILYKSGTLGKTRQQSQV